MKIYVITPVYNAEKYITQAVESALQFPEIWTIEKLGVKIESKNKLQ
jgi:glycosyltransferase involved in cell wall biosynthesis